MRATEGYGGVGGSAAVEVDGRAPDVNKGGMGVEGRRI